MHALGRSLQGAHYVTSLVVIGLQSCSFRDVGGVFTWRNSVSRLNHCWRLVGTLLAVSCGACFILSCVCRQRSCPDESSLTYFHCEVMGEGRIFARLLSISESLTNEWVCEEKGASDTLLIITLAWFFTAQCSSYDWHVLELQFRVRAFDFFPPSLMGRGWNLTESRSQHTTVIMHSNCVAENRTRIFSKEMT